MFHEPGSTLLLSIALTVLGLRSSVVFTWTQAVAVSDPQLRRLCSSTGNQHGGFFLLFFDAGDVCQNRKCAAASGIDHARPVSRIPPASGEPRNPVPSGQDFIAEK